MTTQPDTAAAPEHDAPLDLSKDARPDGDSGVESERRSAEPARWTRFRYTLPGAWVALLFVCLSFTPSLLPRPAFFQGFVCGVNGAIGYGIGVVAAWLWRQFADRGARSAGRRSWRLFFVIAPLLLVVAYVLGVRWQLQIRELMRV